MGRAGQMALNAAARAGAISFSTAGTNGARFKEFYEYARENNIKYMEKVTKEIVVRYGETLQEKVRNGELTPATAQNLVSAVNSVMDLATKGKWQSVSPTKDCGISQRSGIATTNKSISDKEYTRRTESLPERISALVQLQRTLGLRFEESAKLDAAKALRQATTNGSISIKAGTKGGRAREIPASPEAIAALKFAMEIQGKDRSMIPGEKTYVQFRDESYRELREVEAHGFHAARHAWAQERYRELAGADAPIVHGWTRGERFERLAEALSVSVEQAREIDAEARMQVARDLGHGRMDVTDAYLG